MRDRDVDKAPDAFRTISEVGEDLDLPQHVLRFWETRFPQIKPLKRGGGRRYYRPDDVELLKGIRHLLYGEGYTIKGVQRILKEEGLRYVQTIWSRPTQTDAAPSAKTMGAAESLRASPVEQSPPVTRSGAASRDIPLRVEPSLNPIEPPSPQTDVRLERADEDAPRSRPPAIAPYQDTPEPSKRSAMRAVSGASGFSEMSHEREAAHEHSVREPRYGDSAAPARVQQGLPVSDIRNLQAALFELGECRRLLGLAMVGDPAADV